MSTLAPPEQRTGPPRAAGPDAPERATVPATARRGAVVLAMRVLALLIAFGSSVLLARALGPAGLGVFEHAMAWAAVLAVPAGLGADQLVVREVAAARATGRFDLVRGIAKCSAWSIAGSAALVALLAAAIALLLGERAPTGMLLVACGVVPLAALLRVRRAVLQGLSHVVTSQLAELLVAPATFLALLAALAFATGALTPTAALACQVCAFAVALLLVIALLRRRTPAEVRAAEPTYRVSLWARALAPIAVIAGLQVLNARLDVVMLGALSTDGEVGRYASANRFAALIAVPLLAANAALAPSISQLHATGDRRALQRTLTRTARWTFAAAAPIGCGLLLFGDVALGVFGRAFATADRELLLLALGQLANVAFGSVGLVLMMTGNMRPLTLGLALGAATNAALNAALIPRHGALGAAIATATGMLVWNAAHAFAVRRRLGLVAGVLGPLGGAA